MDLRIIDEGTEGVINILDKDVKIIKYEEISDDIENVIIISKNNSIKINMNKVLSLYFPKYGIYLNRFSSRDTNLEELSYLKILHDVITTGELRETRNGRTYSKFHGNLTFDLSTGFPLLTTKKMFFRGILEETLFFLRGQTNTQILSDKGVKIWESNTTREFLDKSGLTNIEERDMGPMYGFQFYHFGAEYPKDGGFNQFEYVINLLKTDRNSRRIIMTSFNPSQAMQGCLYPCHSLILQFYVEKGEKEELFKLSMVCYNRSQDLFLGTPWNVAYAGLIIHIICSYINSDDSLNFRLTPGKLYLDMGDIHVYEPHVNSCIKQIFRLPYQFPQLNITSKVKAKTFMEYTTGLTLQDFSIFDYKSHAAIKEDMIA